MYIRRVKFSRQSTSFTALLGKNVGRLLLDRRAHTEPKTAMSHPHVFFCIAQCGKVENKPKSVPIHPNTLADVKAKNPFQENHTESRVHTGGR